MKLAKTKVSSSAALGAGGCRGSSSCSSVWRACDGETRRFMLVAATVHCALECVSD